MSTVITIRPDREGPMGPPTALPVEEGEPLEPLPVSRSRGGELRSPVALFKTTVHRYLTREPDERRRLIKRGTKGWYLGPVEPDWLRPLQPERIESSIMDADALEKDRLQRRVVTRRSIIR